MAVNKALTSIIKKQSISVIQLIEYLICTLAHNNKNPRVKQLILEKVDYTISEDIPTADDLLSIFKLVKERVVGLI